MNENDIDFTLVSPYSTRNKIYRIIWGIVWFVCARPFPKTLMREWKIFLLRLFGAKIGPRCTVLPTANIFLPYNLEMREGSCIGGGAEIYNATKVVIGRCAVVSQGAYLCTASHNIYSRRHEQTEHPIIIGDRAWVAARATIGPGVTVGEGAVVGAAAAVFKNVEPWTVVGGNPAKFIKRREFKD